jgi:hypothetical protein
VEAEQRVVAAVTRSSRAMSCTVKFVFWWGVPIDVKGERRGQQPSASLHPRARVATDKSCIFDLHGVYADGSSTDSTSVDLCKDKNVNLVEWQQTHVGASNTSQR